MTTITKSSDSEPIHNDGDFGQTLPQNGEFGEALLHQPVEFFCSIFQNDNPLNLTLHDQFLFHE